MSKTQSGTEPKKSKLEELLDHIKTLKDLQKTLEEKKQDLLARKRKDQDSIDSQYRQLVAELDDSKKDVTKKIADVYARKTNELDEVCKEIRRSIEHANDLKHARVEFQLPNIPNTDFSIKLNVSDVRTNIAGIQMFVDDGNKQDVKTVKREIKTEPESHTASVSHYYRPGFMQTSLQNSGREESMHEYETESIGGRTPLHGKRKSQANESDDNSNDSVPPEDLGTPAKRIGIGAEEFLSGGGKLESVKWPHKLKEYQVRDVLTCTKCNKPRCVYSEKKLSKDNMDVWNKVKPKVNLKYSCGSSIIFSDSCSLDDILQIEFDATCDKDVSYHYFSSAKFPTICYVCAAKDNIVNISAEEKARYRSYHPVCKKCENRGKKPRIIMKKAARSEDTADPNMD